MLPYLGQKHEEIINLESCDSCLNNQVDGKTFNRLRWIQSEPAWRPELDF